MSPPNRSKKLINLTNSSGNKTSGADSRCSSSGSDDGDTARNNLAAPLDTCKPKSPSSGSEDGDTGRNKPTTKSSGCGSSEVPALAEADADLMKMFTSASTVDETPADVKMVRICAFNSNECECLLVVDEPARPENKESMATPATKARKVFKPTEELLRRKLHEKGLKLYEWRSLKKRRQVVASPVTEQKSSAEHVKSVPQPPLPPPPLPPPPLQSRKRSVERGPSLEADSKVEPEEANKKVKYSTKPTFEMRYRNATDSLSAKRWCQDAIGTSAAEQRTRVLQQFLREYSRAGARKANQQLQQPKMVQLKNFSMVITDDCNDQGSRRSRWNDFSILRNIGGANLLLNDDNVTGVSNNTTDANVTDGNNDSANNSNSDDNDSKTKKRNRCALCRKKVGLTGFECRCGGLYCGIHRYSDKHNCTFDYRQLGAQEIRRNNPVVIGEKIQKI